MSNNPKLKKNGGETEAQPEAEGLTGATEKYV
jgi:hypothetical protein